MILSCKVIEDILPLYHDGVCSDESRELVEKHLCECENCRIFLQKLDDKLTLPKEQSDDLKPLQSIRSEWIRIRKRSLLKGFLCAVAAVTLILGGWWCLTQWKCMPVSTEKIEISEMSVLRDGEIAFRLLIDDGRELMEVRTVSDDEAGVLYLTPKRSVIESKCFTDAGGERIYRSLNGDYFFMEADPYTKEQYADPAYEDEIAAYHEENPFSADISIYGEIDKVCVGTRRDHIVIWERGDELPQASEELQRRFDNGWR